MQATPTLNKLSVRDIIVDFLGSLVPGIVFTGVAFFLFAITLFSLIVMIFILTKPATFLFDLTSYIKFINSIISTFRVETFIFFIILSYVMGYTFYRQDLKYPDKASFNKIFQRQIAKYKKDENIDELEGWVAKEEAEVEYPYTNLYGYLESRGLTHLKEMIPWRRDKTEEDHIRRTKFFIGMLKIRLVYNCPEKCTTITRNEAHIRLSSTTWYLAKSVIRICYVSFIVAFISFCLSIAKKTIGVFPENLYFILPLIIVCAIWLVMYRLVRVIERFFHYQRVREIVFVLETAYALFREQPQHFKDIFPEMYISLSK